MSETGSLGRRFVRPMAASIRSGAAGWARRGPTLVGTSLLGKALPRPERGSSSPTPIRGPDRNGPSTFALKPDDGVDEEYSGPDLATAGLVEHVGARMELRPEGGAHALRVPTCWSH